MSKAITPLVNEVYIGDDAFLHLSEFLACEKPRSKKVVLVDENTRKHCLPLFLKNVNSLQHADVIEIRSGELIKSLTTCEFVWNELTRLGVDRQSLLINLGGGVVGDLGGFIASTYLRGIDFINIPTTLLAMVDASVGGKNGINFAGLKNQIGAFTQPHGVFISHEFLKTLPMRELRCGFAETIKHALIADNETWMSIAAINNLEEVNWIYVITESVKIKSAIVQSDFRDQSSRKTLNFGHTIGHALESYSLSRESDPLKHGEALAFGLVAEIYLSTQMLKFPEADAQSVYSFIREHFRNCTFPAFDKELLSFMKGDKKNEFSEFNFVLLKKFGEPMFNQRPDEKLILEAIDFAFQQMNQSVQQD